VPPQHARLAELLATVLPQLGEVYTNMEMHLEDAAWVSHRLAEILPLPLPQKQALLELGSPLERLDLLTAMASVTRE
jgi:Lon protease-like protein